MPLKFSAAAGVCDDNESSSICGTMQRTSVAVGELARGMPPTSAMTAMLSRTSNHDDLDERDDGELNERRSWTTLTKPGKFSFMWVQSWLA